MASGFDQPTERVNILLVDDQPGKLMSYELILAGLGQNLLKAPSAKDALELLLKNDVAVILADVCMPDLDGFELAQMIREHPRFVDTAIIFISAVHLSELDSLKGYELGGVDYVPVPVVPEVLRAKVRVFVDLYRKTRALARVNEELERRVTERTAQLEAAIERQELLAREVDHRARNALAVIQAIVSLTPADDADKFAAAVKGRIRAMATAHNLLSETRWSGADLLRLMHEELAPYASNASVAVDGPPVAIVPRVAQNLALALHELATNAAKYGALSSADGKLHVTWRLGDRELVLEWDEQCSHPVSTPARSSFGSRVVDTSIKAQLGGSLEREWRRDGLRCTLRLPALHFAPGASVTAGPIDTHRLGAANLDRIAGRRVLVVEDEPLVSMMMQRLVSQFGGHVVGPFSGPRDARSALDTEIDAALLDVNAGDEMVYPLAEELLARDVPIIFVTGYQAEAIDPRFADAPLLTKPIEPDELAVAVARLIASKDALRRSAEVRA
ncbi:response regulator [Vitreimonas sp.]|uniref:response regulator n=1 Tax=Vitreimonas sp. TaxID=3069702 RepID=UPI002D78BC04|nr:response regulator [Vitreimonas sp.]